VGFRDRGSNSNLQEFNDTQVTIVVEIFENSSLVTNTSGQKFRVGSLQFWQLATSSLRASEIRAKYGRDARDRDKKSTSLRSDAVMGKQSATTWTNTGDGQTSYRPLAHSARCAFFSELSASPFLTVNNSF
jgi:hypothetical protein